MTTAINITTISGLYLIGLFFSTENSTLGWVLPKVPPKRTFGARIFTGQMHILSPNRVKA